MKKKYLLFGLLLAGGLTLASCNTVGAVPIVDSGDNGEIITPWEDYSVPLSGIRISKDCKVVELNKTETKDISFSVDPKNASVSAVSWRSTDESVATVTPGNGFSAKITAIGGGECEIIASNSDDTIKDTASVTVNVPIEDFSLSASSMHLDFTQEADIDVTFTPADTTYRDLIWTSSNEEAVTVSGGHLKANMVAASNVKIKATSERLNKTLEVTVDVSDDWNYVDTVSLSAPATRYEVDETFNLSSTVTGIRAGDAISTQESVKYVTSTPNLVEVDENSGKVTTVKDGTAKFRATILDTRSGLVKESSEVSVEVFEVRATDIRLNGVSKDTVELDNVTNNTLNLEYTLTLNDTGATKPSRDVVRFTSSDKDVVTVDEESGVVTVVGKGSARVTATVINPRINEVSNVLDYVDVNVTIISTKLALTCSKSTVAVGETITLTTSFTPSKEKLTNSDIEFTAVPSDAVEITNNNDGTADVKALKSGQVQITARNGATVSNYVLLTLKVEFSNENIYIVGSSDFSSATSTDTGISWNDAEKAFILDEPIDKGPDDPADLVSQIRGTVHFNAGDEFKLRQGDTWFDNIKWHETSEGSGEWVCDEHVEDAGVVAAGKVIVSTADGDGYGNLKVVVEGTYRVLFKTYENGWYSIYIDDAPVFRFEKAPASVRLGETVEAKVSDYVTSVSLAQDNSNVELSEVDENGNFTIKGMALGQTVISATDAEQTIHYTITVSDKPTVFESGHIYLVGNRDYSTGVSSSGTSWNDPTQSFEFLHEVADASLKKQYKGEFTFKSGDEFKFRTGPTDTDWLNELYCEENDVYGTGKAISRTALDANFVVGTGGDYDIYFKIGFDDGMSISIVERVAPELHIDKTSLTVQVGGTGTIKASDWVGTLDATSGDTSKATVSKATDGTITVTGVAVGTVDISIKDDERTLHCTVTVQSEPVPQNITIYFAGVSGWTGINEMHFALDGVWVNASATTGTDASIGQYKYVFETSSNASTLNCWFKENDSQYRHPSSGTQDWDTDYSTIKLGSVTLAPGNSYVITFTSWHYNYGNWEHAWFNYTFAKLS